MYGKNSECQPELNLKNANDYYILQPRTETLKKSPIYTFPTLLNALSPFIKLQKNRTTFRWALKAHLLEELAE
jgi:hypothetical protein